MNKRTEALAMLNECFLSTDGLPVREAIITEADFRLLVEALAPHSETVGRWQPYPAEKPKPDCDSRHLCILVHGDMHWIGIRSYRQDGDYWIGSGNTGEGREQVWYFKPLLADGERLPAIPNAREQAEDPNDSPEIRWQRTTR